MLDKERKFYDAHVQEWATRSPGSFVVVKEEELVGIYPTMDAALSAGAERFGLQSFLVRELGVEPEVVYIPALIHGLLRGRR